MSEIRGPTDHDKLLRMGEDVRGHNLPTRDPMVGRRHDRIETSCFEAGEYGRGAGYRWYGRPPGTNLIADLSGHEVTEHEDGTITVTPSILVANRPAGHPDRVEWHGYLERGTWRASE